MMLVIGTAIISYITLSSKDEVKATKIVKGQKQNFKAPMAKRQTRPFKAKKLSPTIPKKAKRIEPKKTRAITRGVKPFKESKVFKEFEEENKELLDNAFSNSDQDLIEYDDGTSPVEQDPVRSKVSKETLDPLYETEMIEGVESQIEDSNLVEEDFEGEIFDGEEEIQ